MTNRVFLLVIIPFLLMSCYSVPKYDVYISSFRGASLGAHLGFSILPENKDVNPDDLEFQEFSTYVIRGLQEKGFVLKPYEEADILILLDYGISEPTTTTHVGSRPVWDVKTQSYGHATTSYTRTTYVRTVTLRAIESSEYKDSGKINEIWKTAISSTGSSSDLRQVFPIMIAAAYGYFGVDTKQQIEITIQEDDPRILVIIQ